MTTINTENSTSVGNEKLTTLINQIMELHPDLTFNESLLIAEQLITTLTNYLDNSFVRANVDAAANKIRNSR